MQVAFTNSFNFAEILGVPHIQVLKVIKNILEIDNKCNNWFVLDYFKNNRNREYAYYRITRDGYFMLLMSYGKPKNKKTRDKLFELQQAFITDFIKLSKATGIDI